MINAVSHHTRIVTSLVMREVITRYGRRGLGFLWLVLEPLLFTFAIITLWSFLKAPYQHGLPLAPFLLTGYMSLLMLRHLISYSLGAMKANSGLLFHQNIKVLHVFLARYVLEFGGATLAFFVGYVILMAAGQLGPPHNLLILYWGWVSLFWFAIGMAMILAALAAEFEVFERLVPVFMYMILPLSGVFIMAAWVPDSYRDIYMKVPIPHAIEMIRAGVFGEFVETHYDPLYPLFWGAVLITLGLLMLARAKDHIDAE